MWHFFGHSPAVHHLANLVLHAGSAVLLFLVLRRMTGRLWPSAASAALFAVHPLRVESVAWVTERKDVLSGLFFVLTLAAYLGYVRRPFSFGRYLAVVACLAACLAAKPMAVTLPFLLLLLDYWPLQRGGARSGRGTRSGSGSTEHGAGSGEQADRPACDLGKTAYAGDCRFFCLWAARWQAATTYSSQKYSLPWRIGNAVLSYAAYLGQFFRPWGLTPHYARRLALPSWQVAAAAVTLALITAAAVRWRRQCPYLLVGWLWYLGMLVPVIGLVQIGVVAEADRFTYLPQIGLAIALVWGAGGGLPPPGRGYVPLSPPWRLLPSWSLPSRPGVRHHIGATARPSGDTP